MHPAYARDPMQLSPSYFSDVTIDKTSSGSHQPRSRTLKSWKKCGNQIHIRLSSYIILVKRVPRVRLEAFTASEIQGLVENINILD